MCNSDFVVTAIAERRRLWRGVLDGSEKTEAGDNGEVIVISNFRTKKIPSLVWRECINKAGAILFFAAIAED